MASGKRKLWAEETESKTQKKKQRKKKAATETETETETERMEDRLSDLPEDLKLRILGCLDPKQAVQTSMLSRSWVSLWTRIPVLEFNPYYFPNPRRLRKFVKKILSRHDPLAKLDSLKLYIKDDPSYTWKSLKSVFEYAFLHGVKHLEASIEQVCGDDSWPVRLCDSLTSLELQSTYQDMRCPFLGPRSVLFKNLTVLYLERALITDVEPFSGFPVLESLTFFDCYFEMEKISETLKIHALRLSDLTILDCSGVKCWELSTPRLRFFKYHVYGLLKHEGLPILDTLEINFDGFSCYDRDKEAEKLMFDKLMSLFSALPPNIKSLTLFSSTVLLLSLFPDELMRRGGSPFRELKDLKLDFSRVYFCPTLFHKPCDGWYNSVKAYLLHNSPDAEFNLTNPKDIDDMEWSDDDPWKTLLMQLDYPKTKEIGIP